MKGSLQFAVLLLLAVVVDLSSGGPPPRPFRRQRKLLEFYHDVPHAQEFANSAAYIELKYPFLRHPRHNTLFHHKSAPFPPPGPPPPGPPPPPGKHSVVTYTKTTTIEKDPLTGFSSQSDHWDEPVYETDGHGHSHSSSSSFDVEHHGSPSYEYESSPSVSSVDVEDHDHVSYDERPGPPIISVDGPSRSSSGSSSSSYLVSHDPPKSYHHHSHSHESDPGPLDLYNTKQAPQPPPIRAPLKSNLAPVRKEEEPSLDSYSQPRKTKIPIQPGEKVLKNVQTEEFIWVRREEDSPNIRLTLDPVRKSTYYIDDVPVKRRIHVVSRERVCIQGPGISDWKGRKPGAASCLTPEEDSIQWDFKEIKHGQYWIQQSGTNLCLRPESASTVPRFVGTKDCDLYDRALLWEVGTVEEGVRKGWN